MKFTLGHIALLIDFQKKNIKRSTVSATRERYINELSDSNYITNTNDDWYTITTHGLNLLVLLTEAATNHCKESE